MTGPRSSIPRATQAATPDNPSGLTGRQLDVLALLAEGLTNAEIAERLVLSPRTVDRHVSTILSKLGTATRRDARGGAAMSYNKDAHKLEHALSEISGVRYVALQWCGPGQLEVGVVLATYDYDVRTKIIDVVDDFHRAHVQDLSVDLDIVDVEHAGHLFADA